jgi:hypothetical protein
MTPHEWIFSHRWSWMAVYVFFRNARVNLIVILMTYVRYLYSINCPTVICLPSMLLFILWRDTTSELWTLVQFPLHCYYHLLLLALFTFLHTITFYHSIRLILCLQQTGEIDNLIISWGQSSWLCCVGSMLLLVKSFTPIVSSGADVWSVVKLASIAFWSLAFSYWFDNLGFTTKGNLLLCSLYLPLGVPNWVP